MKTNKIRALRGPNFWSRRTALEASLDIADSELAPAEVAAFQARIGELLPNLKSAVGDISPVQSTSLVLAQAIGRVALRLLNEAGCGLDFGLTTSLEPGTFLVVVEYREEEVGRQALDAAIALVQAALAGQPFDVAATVHKLRSLDEQLRLGPSTGSIVRAAQAEQCLGPVIMRFR